MKPDEISESYFAMPRWMHIGLMIVVAVLALWTYLKLRASDRRMNESIKTHQTP